MKKITFLFLIILSCPVVFAQTSSRYQDFKKWSYGITGGLTTNFRILSSNGTEQFLKDDKDNMETRRTSYSAGLVANYRLNDKLSINSGLVFDDLGYRTKTQTLRFSDGTTTDASSAYHFRYITIPLDLKYDFYRQQYWDLYIGGGVSPAIFIGETTAFTYGGTKNNDTQAVGYDRFNFIGDLRAGADFWIADNLKLTAGIFYKQFINPTNSNLPTKAYLNSAGVTAGIVYLRRAKRK